MAIDAHKFLMAFHSVWNQKLTEKQQKLITSFKKDSTWTPQMLGDDGILRKVSDELQREQKHRMGREWYKLDTVFVSGEDLYGKDLNYPSEFLAIIEHENGPNVEEEMWKLIHWRAPLKVLIFYGWPNTLKSESSREKWAHEKMEKLRQMAFKVEDFNPESQQTEYVFLMGSLEEGSEVPIWHWASLQQGRWRLLGRESTLDEAKKVADKNDALGRIGIDTLNMKLHLHLPFEESISPHGKLIRVSHLIQDSIDSIAKREGVNIEKDEISYRRQKRPSC